MTKTVDIDGPDGMKRRRHLKMSCTWRSGGGPVVICGAFSVSGKTELRVVQGRQTAAGWLCGDVAAGITRDSRAVIREADDWVVQQDSAAGHNAHLTRDFFQVDDATPLDCPACCPDLDPVESFRGWMARGHYKKGQRFQTVDALCEATFQNSLLDRLTSCMLLQIFEVINKNGGAIHFTVSFLF